MGVPGPCGPSSEIFFDKGPAVRRGRRSRRRRRAFIEFWNLVFMQNIQDEPYHVVGDLPSKNIDTGAGLERVATVLQGVRSVFDTDLLRPVLATAEGVTGAGYGDDERTDVSLRILADHGRAVTFLIARQGGALQRGPRLRAAPAAAAGGAPRLAPRGPTTWSMPRLIDATVDVMGDGVPGATRASRTASSRWPNGKRSGSVAPSSPGTSCSTRNSQGWTTATCSPEPTAFKLHDTYGFPRELTEEILAERGIELDLAEFDRMMTEQRDRARRHYKGGDAATQGRGVSGPAARRRAHRVRRLRSTDGSGTGPVHRARGRDRRAGRSGRGRRGVPRSHPLLRRVGRPGGRHAAP